MSKKIGPNFSKELQAAGVIDIPFSWGADGSFSFEDGVTDAQKAQVMAVYKAHQPEATGAQMRSEVERLRLLAYADPITGSDRYFAEASRMDATGESGSGAYREAGVKRYSEIQSQFPWPAE